MRVLSVNIGSNTRLSFAGEHVRTGIFKSPVESRVYLTRTGPRGDVQVDRKNHGGEDKAVCVYCADHYAFWEEETGMHFPVGTFGENLTVSRMLESDTRIGDIYAIGRTRLQVSQPRQPCHKLGKKIGDPTFSARVIELGLTGFYLRVLDEGDVGTDDPIQILSRDEATCTIEYANRVMYDRLEGEDGLQRLLSNTFLSDSWRQVLSSRSR